MYDRHRWAIYRDRASHRFGQGEGEAASQRPRIDYDRIGPGIWQRLCIDIISGSTHQLTSQRCSHKGPRMETSKTPAPCTEAHPADAHAHSLPGSAVKDYKGDLIWCADRNRFAFSKRYPAGKLHVRCRAGRRRNEEILTADDRPKWRADSNPA